MDCLNIFFVLIQILLNQQQLFDGRILRHIDLDLPV